MARYPGGRTPQIAEIAPRIFEGGEIRIAGRYFQDGASVLVDGREVGRTRRISDTEVRLTPAETPGRGWHEVTVRNPNGLQDTRMLGFHVRQEDARTEGWTWYTPSNSALGSRYVYAAAADPRGGVWFGTNRGINYFDGANWKLIREEPGGSLDDVIYDLDPSDGNLWFTCFHGAGALHRDGTRERWTWKEAGFGGHQINQVLRADGATYISTHNRQGFFVFRDRKWSRIALPEYARGLVNSIVKGPDGRLWLGTGSGVLSWDPRGGADAWQHYDGLPDNVRRIAFDRRGRLWAGTATHGEADTGGLCMLEDGRWTVYSRANSPLPERRVWSVFVDHSGGVWAATSKGAARLGPDGQWSVYNVANSGLGDDVVTDIVEDTSGGMWFATSYGVSRLARR
jgi:ligand-binding sensor domain-containing protein